ncbi:hypothetical protein [Cocleimonas flava]|nr:hypothetical protein [Cocleimonas flava]
MLTILSRWSASVLNSDALYLSVQLLDDFHPRALNQKNDSKK